MSLLSLITRRDEGCGKIWMSSISSRDERWYKERLALLLEQKTLDAGRRNVKGEIGFEIGPT